MKYRSLFVKQLSANDCGCASLATVCKFYNFDVTLDQIKHIAKPQKGRGSSIWELEKVSEEIGFTAQSVKLSEASLDSPFTLPAIVHFNLTDNLSHFTVILKVTKDHVHIMDPASGYEVYTKEDFWKICDGYCLILVPNQAFDDTKKKYKKTNKGIIKSFFVDVMHNNVPIFIGLIIASLFVVLLGTVYSYSYQTVIDVIVANSMQNLIWVLLFGFGLVSVAKILFTMLRQHLTLKFGMRVNVPVIDKYYRHILKLSLTFFDNTELGDIIIRCQDALAIKEFLINTIVTLALNIPMIILSVIVLTSISLSMFGVVLVSVILVSLLSILLRTRYQQYEQKEKMHSSKFQNNLIDSLKNIHTIKAYGKEKMYSEKLKSAFDEYTKIGYKKGNFMNVQSTVQSTLVSVANVILLAISAYLIISSVITAGTMMTFFSISAMFFESVVGIVGLIFGYESFIVSLKRLAEVHSEEEELMEETPSESTQIENNGVFEGSIEVENVSYGYAYQTKTVDNISLSIKSGAKVAFVGQSGSGKTTFSKLISGLYKPTEGCIKINGKDISKVDKHSLRKHISIVSQKPEIFTDTVSNNLLFDAKDFETMGKLKYALEVTSSEKIKNTENACDLSQGEQQKLSIIRALTKDGDIFVLDEATSNLDCFGEKQIVDLFLNKMEEKTVIMITHKLSLVENCDQIFLFDNGKIIEQGNHSELMAKNGNYRKMWELQN